MYIGLGVTSGGHNESSLRLTVCRIWYSMMNSIYPLHVVLLRYQREIVWLIASNALPEFLGSFVAHQELELKEDCNTRGRGNPVVLHHWPVQTRFWCALSLML